MLKKHDLGISPYIENIGSRDQSLVKMGTSRVTLQAGQESVLLLSLDLGQVTPHVLTKLLALSPGEASGCRDRGGIIDLHLYVLTCVVEIETPL